MSEIYYSTSEAAKLIGVTPLTIKHWIYKGKIKAIKGKGRSGHYKIPKDEVLKNLRIPLSYLDDPPDPPSPEVKALTVDISTGRFSARLITSDLIADGAIVSSKIASLSIGTGHIANGAITSAKIASGAVGNAHIAAEIDASKITSGRFSMSRMPDGGLGEVLIAQGIGSNPIYGDLPRADLVTSIT
ncbi:MAG: helix-turn-helix domain-containing protein, partial [Nitrososphaerales archaeon]